MTRGRQRANGEGSIFPYRNGYAAYVWVTTPDGKRRRKWVYGKTRQDVHGKWLKLHDGARRGPVPTSSPTLAQYMTYWLREVVVPPNYAPLTCATYETLHAAVRLARPRLQAARQAHLARRARLAQQAEGYLPVLRAGQGRPPIGETTPLLRQGSGNMLSAAGFGTDHPGRLDDLVQRADQCRHRGPDPEERRQPGPRLRTPYAESEAVDSRGGAPVPGVGEARPGPALRRVRADPRDGPAQG